MTHKSLFALLIALFPVIATSCSDDDDEDLIGHWVRTSDFDGSPVEKPPAFPSATKDTWSEDIPVKPA